MKFSYEDIHHGPGVMERHGLRKIRHSCAWKDSESPEQKKEQKGKGLSWGPCLPQQAHLVHFRSP